MSISSDEPLTATDVARSRRFRGRCGMLRSADYACFASIRCSKSDYGGGSPGEISAPVCGNLSNAVRQVLKTQVECPCLSRSYHRHPVAMAEPALFALISAMSSKALGEQLSAENEIRMPWAHVMPIRLSFTSGVAPRLQGSGAALARTCSKHRAPRRLIPQRSIGAHRRRVRPAVTRKRRRAIPAPVVHARAKSDQRTRLADITYVCAHAEGVA